MRAPVHESTLPPILGVAEMCALLGMSKSGLYNAMKRPGWIFPPLPQLDRAPRWSRDQVVATLAAVSPFTTTRRRA